LDTRLRVVSRGEDLLLPLRGEPLDAAYPVEEADFAEVEARPCTYRDVCRVPDALRGLLPVSFDQVGDIVVLKLPEPLAPFAAEIGRAILETQRTARVVAADAGVKGPFRVRELRVVAGEARTVTEHREHGMRLRVDLAKAYFSPRLATERLRVAGLVRDGEIVVDLFSGVGPLAVLIARRRRPKAVYAVDANPEAFRFLEENVRINRAGSVVPVLQDALAFLTAAELADRMVMDLPHGGRAFLPAAVRATRMGGVLHYYEILDDAERDPRAAELESDSRAIGREGAAVTAIHPVHAYSPTQGLYAFELSV